MDTTISSKKNKSGGQTILWWVLWITFTILAFFAAVAIWTPLIASHFGSIQQSRNAVIWVIAVFGTWMIILVPLIIVMYSKVDKVYEDARIRRETAANRFRSLDVARTKRLISSELSNRLHNQPETIKGGHLVNLQLKDGRQISNVFIANGSEILGIYNETEMSFEGKDVVGLELVDMAHPTSFFTPHWLRLDGVKAPE